MTPASFRQTKHEVFLSFRGEDTRNNFVCHLYEALRVKGIATYADFKELQRGEEISHALLKAIGESVISVIVFSENYAASSWCLEELSEVMECRQSRGQLAVPIFYHVNPSDVRRQNRSFQNALLEHEKNGIDKVQRWRHALTEAGNLSGWHLTGDRPENLYIKEIVQDILNKLNGMSKCVCTGLVGIGPKLEQIKSLLCIDGQGIRRIGIWGMGGIGKTVLAETAYNEVFTQFESCCFLANVREEWQKHGAMTLRNQILSKILDEENHLISIPSIKISKLTMDRVCRKRVLVVLDDVSDLDQVESLIVSQDNLGFGSRIIITSRDKQILENVVDEIYEVKELNYHDSLQLFCQYAFKLTHPIDGFGYLSKKFVEHVKGVPLALKVMGQALHKRNREHWQSQLNKLKHVPNRKVLSVLKISFDGLDDEEKNIFLDIACFFKGFDKEAVINILDGCYHHAALCGINNLIDRSLLNITNDNRLSMHDLLQEMGCEIVSEDPIERCSRLWKPEDVYHVLKNNSGSEATKGIFLDLSQISEVQLSPKVFSRMPNLRFLKFYNSRKGVLNLSRNCLKCISDRLMYLYWENCPLMSLPSNFRPEHLVELKLPGSNIEQLWNGSQNLVNLRVIDLFGCKNLLTIPDLSRAINVKRLSISYCKSLVQLPSLVHLKSLHCNLFVSCCPNLKKFPDLPLHLTWLVLTRTAIEELPESIKYADQLVYLDLSFSPVEHLPSTIWNCLSKLAYLNMSGTRIQNLPSTILKSDALETIYLSDCPNITVFPNVPENIKYLCLDNAHIEEVPPSAARLKNLHVLSLANCRRLKNFSTSIFKLKFLHKLDLSGCSILENFIETLETMEFSTKHDYLISVDDSRNMSVHTGFGSLGFLTTLDISESNIVEIPVSVKQLSNLYHLYLRRCKSLKSLIELPPHLRQLDAHGCISLELVSITEQFRYTFCEDEVRFDKMRLSNCFNLDRDGVDNIVANALLKIHRTTKEWAKGCHERPVHYHLDIVIACCETSQRFKYQSTSSSITVPLYPDYKGDRFLGFVPCVVVDFDSNHENINTRIFCKFQLKTKCGDYHSFESEWASRMYNYGPKCFESKHIISWFHDNMLIEDRHYEEASFEFYITDESKGNRLNYIKVECGVHVFYLEEERCATDSAFKSREIFSFVEEVKEPTLEILE